MQDIFTSLVVENYKLFALDKHLLRLSKHPNYNKEVILSKINDLLPLNGTLRIFITSNSINLDVRRNSVSGDLKCCTLEDPRDQFELKITDLRYNLQARDQAKILGYDDAIWINQNLIHEGVFWNIYFYDGNQIITPKNKVLNGVCRQILIDRNIVKEKEINLLDLAQFKSVFYTNSSLLVGNIIRINNIEYEKNFEINKLISLNLKSEIKEFSNFSD